MKSKMNKFVLDIIGQSYTVYIMNRKQLDCKAKELGYKKSEFWHDAVVAFEKQEIYLLDTLHEDKKNEFLLHEIGHAINNILLLDIDSSEPDSGKNDKSNNYNTYMAVLFAVMKANGVSVNFFKEK